MSSSRAKGFDCLIQSFYDVNGLTDTDIQVRHGIIEELRVILCSQYPKIKLEILGSSANGFGMKDSDLDIYLQCTAVSTYIKSIHNVLQDMEKIVKNIPTIIDSVLFIPAANHPVLRFRHRATNINCDISMNTAMSVEDAALLKAYTKVDPRVSVLGCFLKAMAKSVDIAVQAKYSLTSFGYNLMMIHYLQQHCQPVLPILQQLTAQHSSMVDGIDCGYFKDIENLSEMWPHYGQNMETVGQLWFGFLNYYAKFDFDKYVVTISQIECLKKSNHSIDSCEVSGITIANPFKTDINVAGILFKRMSDHIIKTICHWQKYFDGTESNGVLSAQSLLNDSNIKFAEPPSKAPYFRRRCE